MKKWRTVLLIFALIVSGSLSPLWSQSAVSKGKDADPDKTEVFNKAFRSFMDKLAKKPFSPKEKQKVAKKYNDLVDKLDAMYHHQPTLPEKSPIQADNSTKTAGKAVIAFCNRG